MVAVSTSSSSSSRGCRDFGDKREDGGGRDAAADVCEVIRTERGRRRHTSLSKHERDFFPSLSFVGTFRD